MNFLVLYLLAFLSAGLTTFLALPVWRLWCCRSGLVDDPGHRKIHTEPIPLAGGLAVLTGLIMPILLGLLWLRLRLFDSSMAGLIGYGLSRRGFQLAALLLGAIGMVGLGWLDDKHELRPMAKFGGQLAIAMMVAAAGVRITLFVPNDVFSYCATILWILMVTNAFNFLDNMNGLCAGLGAIGAWFFAWSAAVSGQYLVALLASLSCGAFLGFLPYNFPRASAFLGDAGSHLAGYWLAVLAILPSFYSPQNPNVWAVLSPILILAVPLADMAWVVLLRWRRGQPFYIGDTNHISHRLVRRRLSPTLAVLLIWLAAALLGWLSFVLQFFPE